MSSEKSEKLAKKYLDFCFTRQLKPGDFHYADLTKAVRQAKSIHTREVVKPSGLQNRVLHMLERLLTICDANPNSVQSVERYKNLYFGNGMAEELLHKILSHKNELLTPPILQVGPRGSGKSSLQNYIFTQKNYQLEKNNIIYVRADAHKLYKIWRSHKNKQLELSKYCNYSSYLDFQLVYIVAKYGLFNKHSKFLSEIIAKTREYNMPYWVGSTGQITEEPKKLYDRIKDEIVPRLVHEDRNITSSSAMCDVLEQALSAQWLRVWQRWNLISTALKDILGELEVSILHVLDGIDNVLWHHEDRELYTKMVENLETYTSQARGSNILLISLRTETLVKGLAGDVSNETKIGIPSGDIFYQEEVSPDSIVKEKLGYLNDVDKLTTMFGENYVRNRAVGTKEYRDIVSKIFQLAENFRNETRGCIREVIEREIAPDVNSISSVYNNNSRAYSFNLLTYIKSDLSLSRTGGLDDQKLTNFLRREVYRNFFLDGRGYLETTHKSDGSERKGSVYPNIFWYHIESLEAKENDDRWHGLTITRVLQLLISSSVPLRFGQVKSTLIHYLDIPEQLIVTAIHKLIVFGMIEYEPNKNALDDGSDFLLSVTDKAFMCIHLVYSKIDLLYFLTLDSPISSSSAYELRAHHSSDRISFLESCLYSASILMSLAKMEHGRQTLYARSKIYDEGIQHPANACRLNIEDFQNTFADPFSRSDTTNLLSDVSNIIFTLKKDDLEAYRRIKADFLK